MAYNYSDIELRAVKAPEKDCTNVPVHLTDETIEKRKTAVLAKMAERGLDALVVYADLEHGNNFEYLVGFLPRFEEALLVLHKCGKAYLVLGNENLNKAGKARIECEPVLASYFSLPNQPMQNNESFVDILAKTGVKGKRVGLVGWKNFTSRFEDNKKLYDTPHYIVKALEELCGADNVTNEADLYIGGDGVRVVNNANEIAHYEFASALASDCMLDAVNSLKLGVTEMEIGSKLAVAGQRTSVVTIAAFGPRFVKANMYPTDNTLKLGNPISLTIGYRGGLSSRSLVAVESADQLPEGQQDYVEKVVAPYFTAIRAWLENVRIGMTGGEMYSFMQEVLPQETYHWGLCPGHTTAEEEWMSSPIYAGSTETLKSGMLLQTDIIPSVPGYNGTSVESTCGLADEALREEIKKEYPDLWARIQARRDYIINEIGINLSEDVIPMCSTLCYLKPLALSDKAVAVKK